MTRVIRITRRSAASGEIEWATRGDARPPIASRLEALPWTGPCELVLASDLVLLDRVSVPSAQRRRLGDAVRFLVEERVLSDPERIHVAVESRPEGEGLSVGIVERPFLDEVAARLAHAGLEPRAAYPECLLAPLEGGMWCVVARGAEGFARIGEIEGFALDGLEQAQPPAALRLAVERARESATLPARIVVRPAAGFAAPPVQGWSEQLGVPVVPGPPWSWEHGAAPDRLDLLQGEYARPSPVRGLAGKLSRAAVLAAAILAVGSLALALDWLGKSRERRAILAEMAAIYRGTAGAGAPVIDPPRQLARALADLKRHAGEPLPDDFLVMVGVLSDHVVKAGADRTVSLTYEGGVLTADLQSPDAAAERLRDRTVPGYELAVEPPDGERSAARVRLRPVQ